jgi:hypothetical protein
VSTRRRAPHIGWKRGRYYTDANTSASGPECVKTLDPLSVFKADPALAKRGVEVI